MRVQNTRAVAGLLLVALSSPAPCSGRGADETAGDGTAEHEADPCRPAGEEEAWIDVVQHGLFRTVCSSARWFDGFFGDARFDNEAEETWGRLAVDLVYDEHQELEADVRFRAEVGFPNIEHRLAAFLGRENEDDFVTSRNEGFESIPGLFGETDDREWLLGLGYRPVDSVSDHFDFQVGVKLRFPLEPFVQGRFRHYWFLSDTRLVRFRNTVFWRNQHGFGDTVTFDLEQALGQPLLFRWSTSATLSGATAGLDWASSGTLYQRLGELRATSYTAFVDGETDGPVPVERYGLRAVYRQRMFREWFYGQLIAGVNFPRDRGEARETSWELGFGVSIYYGRR